MDNFDVWKSYPVADVTILHEVLAIVHLYGPQDRPKAADAWEKRAKKAIKEAADKFSYLGSYGNAANTVVFPLTVVALSIAVMIGDGCCAFVSISLGKGDPEAAHKSIGSAVLLCVLSGLVLTALYLAFQEPILTLFGGRVNEETFHQAREYFLWITLGIPFYMFGQAMNPVIRSDGSPKFAMASTLAGAMVNIVLDPIFIFVFRWGMMGAAVATVLGQILTSALAVWYLRHMKAVRLERGSFRPTANWRRNTCPWAFAAFCPRFLWSWLWRPSRT